jgi:hypothetical protein|tara:strand:+ start:145 stop:351 length:207 start_codon:yes stop_codon:yes gene_type:complete
MILKLSNEEKQVLKFMFKDERINDLPPAIKEVALEIKRAVQNPTEVTKEQYEEHTLNPSRKHCENCDE